MAAMADHDDFKSDVGFWQLIMADDLAADFHRLLLAGLFFVATYVTNRFLPESEVKEMVWEILLLPIS